MVVDEIDKIVLDKTFAMKPVIKVYAKENRLLELIKVKPDQADSLFALINSKVEAHLRSKNQ